MRSCFEPLTSEVCLGRLGCIGALGGCAGDSGVIRVLSHLDRADCEQVAKGQTIGIIRVYPHLDKADCEAVQRANNSHFVLSVLPTAPGGTKQGR